MVKLTPELIQQSPQYINPVRERELELRGYKIPVIENLGATLDQFDTIDLSDNDIRKLDGFPLLRRLKCLLLNNNRIVRIAEGLEEFLPNLQSLVMTNNLIQELGDLATLLSVKSLQILSLLKNPVTTKKHYRAYVVHKLPQLKLLDFRKIKQRERDEANALFQSKMGKQLEKDIAKRSKTFVPGAALSEVNKGPSPADVIAIKDAISKAKSLEEIERLNMMLKSGFIPGKEVIRPGRSNDDREEMEEMDTDHPNGM